MELASVRALKADLQENSITPLTRRLVAEHAIEIPAGPMRADPLLAAGIALGVAGGKGSDLAYPVNAHDHYM